MHLLKKRSVRFYLGFLLVLALTIGGSAIAALADSPTSQVTVNGAVSGVTENASNVSANTVTLDGTNKTATYTLPISVYDDTATASGWSLTIASTQFSTADCTLTTSHNLHTSTSQITAVAIAD